MTDYEKMQKLIEDASTMLGKDITNSAAEFKAWETSVKRLLNKLFGKDGIEMSTFLEISFYSACLDFNASDAEWHRAAVRSCHEGLEEAIATLKTYLDELQEEPAKTEKQQVNYARIFIVHGHDGEMKQSVARIIEKQGIEAVILSEQVNKGKTIIEKLEGNSDVGGAICLFTSDDEGKGKKETELKPRARQNVVLEAGYFMGKLGRDHVVLLADNGIEMPSDLSGIVYTSTNNWQFDLLKELKAMGYKIDFNKLA